MSTMENAPIETARTIANQPIDSDVIGNMSLRKIWEAYAHIRPPAPTPQATEVIGRNLDPELAIRAFQAGVVLRRARKVTPVDNA